MSIFHPACLPTTVGSMPHTDPAEACDLILRYTPEIPVWPQLPKRDPVERIYTQYLGLFPGAVMDDDRLYVDTRHSFDSALERLYADHLEDATHRYELSPERAAGFAEMRLRLPDQTACAVKGQIIGPISAGVQITDQARRPILYDDVLADALGKYLRLVARAHEQALSALADRTIVILDEPFLNAVGSGLVQISREQVDQLLGEVLDGLNGLRGIHCCDNTDWSLVMSLPIDVLSFDAYNFAETLTLYPDDVKRFLDRGGIIAWGIVPTEQRALRHETVDSLVARLLGHLACLKGKGLDLDHILSASLITPSCGLGTLSPAVALRALELTAQVAHRLRTSYLRIR